jgi:hypothetical protein
MSFKFAMYQQARVTTGEHKGEVGVIDARQPARDGMPAIYTVDTGTTVMRNYFEDDLEVVLHPAVHTCYQCGRVFCIDPGCVVLHACPDCPKEIGC